MVVDSGSLIWSRRTTDLGASWGLPTSNGWSTGVGRVCRTSALRSALFVPVMNSGESFAGGGQVRAEHVQDASISRSGGHNRRHRRARSWRGSGPWDLWVEDEVPSPGRSGGPFGVASPCAFGEPARGHHGQGESALASGRRRVSSSGSTFEVFDRLARMGRGASTVPGRRDHSAPRTPEWATGSWVIDARARSISLTERR